MVNLPFYVISEVNSRFMSDVEFKPTYWERYAFRINRNGNEYLQLTII